MIPVVFDKPTKFLTADTHRQSADKKPFLPGRPSRLRSKQAARAKASCLSGRRADRFAQRLLFLSPQAYPVKSAAGFYAVAEAKVLRPSAPVERAKWAGGS